MEFSPVVTVITNIAMFIPIALVLWLAVVTYQDMSAESK